MIMIYLAWMMIQCFLFQDDKIAGTTGCYGYYGAICNTNYCIYNVLDTTCFKYIKISLGNFDVITRGRSCAFVNCTGCK